MVPAIRSPNPHIRSRATAWNVPGAFPEEPSMTPLRQRMLEDMQIRHLASSTQRASLEHVARFARHFGRSPARLGPEEIRAYQVYLTNANQLAPASIVITVAALRFLYTVTLQKTWSVTAAIPAPKTPQILPVVLSPARSRPVSRRRRGPQASGDPDDLLCRRTAHLGSRAAHPASDRQPADGLCETALRRPATGARLRRPLTPTGLRSPTSGCLTWTTGTSVSATRITGPTALNPHQR